ncbi:hypothetical protein COO60DRAFT_666085 [Scenedesmus sp. NREL 46B-D3]|nr:hypothetical protein COO60DRAFT_666085 [Scenedesmus sp. NREL 46B-D3]
MTRHASGSPMPTCITNCTSFVMRHSCQQHLQPVAVDYTELCLLAAAEAAPSICCLLVLVTVWVVGLHFEGHPCHSQLDDPRRAAAYRHLMPARTHQSIGIGCQRQSQLQQCSRQRKRTLRSVMCAAPPAGSSSGGGLWADSIHTKLCNAALTA